MTTTVPRPEVEARADSGRATRAVVSLLGAALGAAVFGLMYRVPVDDAFIAMDYARQLGLHGNWGMVDGLVSNTATSPLSVLLLGGITAVVRDALVAVGVLLVVSFAVAGVWLHGIADRLGLGVLVFGPLALAVLAVNPLLMSAVGLESQLAVTLLVGAGWAVVARRPGAAGVIAGLLVLTRPDLGPAAMLGLACLPTGRGRALGAAVATALPWFAFSWWFLGSAVPDTVVIKGAESWGGTSFWNSVPHYASILPGPVLLSVAPTVAGALALVWWWRERLAWVWAGTATAHYVTMSVLHPGPFFWHSTFWLCGLGLLGCAAAACLVVGRTTTSALVAALAAGYVVITAVTDLNDGVPRDEFAPVSFNWATPAQYRDLASRLPAGSVVISPGEIGTLAWYCECRVVDQFADRGRFTPLLEQRLAGAGPVERLLLEWNYARFDRPAPVPADLRIDTRLVPPPAGEWTSLFTALRREVTVSPVG